MQEQEQKIYEELKQEIDKEYEESKERYGELMAQMQELKNKPNKSEAERVELSILKAQEVQFSFQRAQGRKERFENFVGNAMLDDLKYQSNIIKSLFISSVTGIITGGVLLILSYGVIRFVEGSLTLANFALVVIITLTTVFFFVSYIGRSEKWGNMTKKEIEEDIIDKHPIIFKNFENEINAEKKLERSTIYKILARWIFFK